MPRLLFVVKLYHTRPNTSVLLSFLVSSSILRPCCEALERVSRTEEGREAFEERGTCGVLLATIRFVG